MPLQNGLFCEWPQRQRVVLERRAGGPCDVVAAMVDETQAAADAVGTVLRDFDLGRTGVIVIDLGARLHPVDRVGQGTRRAVADGADDLVHPPAARRDERLLVGAEGGLQSVGAEARVLADAPVVEDRHLLADVGVAPVGNAVRILVVGKAGLRVATVAERLDLRGPAATESHRGPSLHGPAERVEHAVGVRRQIRPVVRDLDLRHERSLHGLELCKAIGSGALREIEGELLQGRGRLGQVRVIWPRDAGIRRRKCQPPEFVGDTGAGSVFGRVGAFAAPGAEGANNARA
jgi:hypothetical protein